MASTKVVTFDAAYRYSRAGAFDHADAIVLCEPSFLQQRVWHQMRAYVTEAEKGFAIWVSAARANAPKTDAAPDAPPEKKDEDPVEILEVLRMGLTAERYIDFVEYVQKALTGATSLAWIGSDVGADPKARYGLNHEFWNSLGEANGMNGVEKVISQFASFFLGRSSPKPLPMAQTETAVGSILPSVPVAAVKEPSPSRKR